VLRCYLQDSWRFFGNNFSALAWIILPIAVPIEVITALLSSSVADDTLLGPQLLLILVGLMAAAIRDENISPMQSWLAAKEVWAAYLLLSLLAMVVIAFGLSLLILPGIYFAAKYAFASFELVLNRQTAIASLQQSWTKTTGLMPVLIGGGFIITGVIYLPYFAVIAMLDQAAPVFIAFEAVFNIGYALFSSLYTIFAYRVYIENKK
jgi:hypothetical protein